MTSVGINAASLEAQTASFVSVSMSQVTVTASQSFSSVLKGSMANGQQTQDAIRTYKDIKPNVNKDEVVKASTPVSANETKVQSAEEDNVITESGTAENELPDMKTDNTTVVSTDAQKTDSIDDNDIDDCVKAIEILNTLFQGIADLLNTSIEELQGCYEQLDLQPSQMFTVTSIQLTVVTIEGLTDTSDLLVNNDAFEMFNRIMDFVQSVLEDAGMDMPQFQNILTGDAFVDFAGPIETGNIQELLQKFSFDENGKLIVENKNEENVEPVGEDIQAEPFAVEVNIEKTSSNDSTESDSQKGTDQGISGSSVKEESKTSKAPASLAESFIQGLENAAPVTDIDMPVAEGVTVRDIVYQVVDAIRVNISEESTSLEMNLNPENLGRVNLNIQSRDGVMTAQITAENDIARAAIESQLQILKDNIEAQGVRVEAIEVTVSSFSFSDSRNSESEAREHPEDGVRVGRSSRTSQSQTDEAESVQAQEKLEQEVMEQNGSTVNFVA